MNPQSTTRNPQSTPSAALDARVAVITGGTGGLGTHVTTAFLQAGCTCHVTYRLAHERQALEQQVSTGRERLILHSLDATDPDQVHRLYRTVAEESGRLDFLLNLVGGFAAKPIEDTGPDLWDKMVAINARSAFLNIRQAVALMRQTPGGCIVNVSAAAAQRCPPRMAAYVAAKAAVMAMTRSLAKELADEQISVNAILPTTIDTPANRKAMPDADFSTWNDPREIARRLVALAGDPDRPTGELIELDAT